MAELNETAHAAPDRPGRPAGIACPDRDGAMFELVGQIGSATGVGSGARGPRSRLLTEQDTAAESALWTAIRTLEEKAALHRRLSNRDGAPVHRVHRQRAIEAEAGAAAIRDLLRRTAPGHSGDDGMTR